MALYCPLPTTPRFPFSSSDFNNGSSSSVISYRTENKFRLSNQSIGALMVIRKIPATSSRMSTWNLPLEASPGAPVYSVVQTCPSHSAATQDTQNDSINTNHSSDVSFYLPHHNRRAGLALQLC